MEAATIGRDNDQVDAVVDAGEVRHIEHATSQTTTKKISKYLIACSLAWLAATVSLFVGEARGLTVPPIAEDAMGSLTMIYLPVFLVVVLLLLFLTRERSSVDWEQVYGVNKATAHVEAVLVLAYLIVTQLILGLAFKIGLHFPGPDNYKTGSHDQSDVWIWACVNAFVYVVLPMAWLYFGGASFSMAKLLSSLQWRRNLWIIFAYWCFDFFGPIVAGAADFFGLTFTQYLGAISLGIFVNTLGAGLPVIVMMHILFLPRVAVLCPVQTRSLNNKMVNIALVGLFYAFFSLFDQGVKYTSAGAALMSFWYIISTQMLVGMGKATFTVVTGNPFIHYITLHVLSARIPFDTKMYAEIFGIK
eukprot:gnl/MRDRNA2_/MRDRNA2_104723_c0_seq1.p1 gnl/MRDRNA2_/MRDRNA2_104723_c0~~gnl/MRDRNA2_/MRDRNA2_104723_c0_seq1.p1  ORF type:complete len:360 (-),score=27.49 gnl/MRDRNA2_/MRDRNA2_104723_c0_seq1:110-1189(-)